MFSKNHILSLLTVALIFSVPAYAQDEKVCIGAKVKYKADGGNGSIYDYKLEQTQAGKIIQTYPDTIIVEWGDTKGVFQLGVRETSEHGCEGNWAYLNVEIVGDYAQFTKPVFSMCGGSGVLVDFDRSNFQAYQWADASVTEHDGYITKPGRYELKTIDRNGCRLSSFIDVIQTPAPKVYLGADTMICTPGFTLYARNTQDNPDGTVYTWSTGESGTLLKSIVVESHDVKKDVKYWVNAEANGCSASDTLVVLACKPAPEAMFIPDTFTPNGDGENDEWNISALKDYPNCSVEVFDRWGRKVFASSKGYTTPWNGRDAKGHYLPMEAYYYVIFLNDGKTADPLFGTITIIR